MIYFLLKNWKLFLDILLVVGGIIAFTLWDPIGMFTNAKTKQTANLVTGVRDIGQLVTAEYYGEVISSWKEFKLTEFPSDTLTDFAEEAWQEVAYIIWLNRNNENGLKQAVRRNSFVTNLERNNAFDEFIACLGNQYLNRKLSKIYKKGELLDGIEQIIYKRMLKSFKKEYGKIQKELGLRSSQTSSELTLEMKEYLLDVPAFIYEFFPFYQYVIEQDLERKKRKNIVFIGRGSVKAGFNFGKLDESNFLYDEGRKVVHFYGIKPTVLDVDINPWFIPERKVKGFELVSFSGDVDFEEAKEVKRQCKQKLLNQARNADIVRRAEANGKEALRNFFSLLLDEPKLVVSFHTHPYDHHLEIIQADTLVDRAEAIFIDSLYQQYRLTSDTASMDEKNKLKQQFHRFVTGLKKLEFLERGHSFSYYSLFAANVLKDTFHIDDQDIVSLKEMRNTLMVKDLELTTKAKEENPIWFISGDFRLEWNATLTALDNASISRYDSALDLTRFQYQMIPLHSNPDSLDYWEESVRIKLQIKEIDTVRKLIIQRSDNERKLRPITRLKTGVNDLIERLKKQP